MAKNIIHLKEHQFKRGFDPKRNTKGAPKGTNLRYVFRQRMLEKHEQDLEKIIGIMMQEACNGKYEYIKLSLAYFVPTDNADNTVDNCDDIIHEEMTNIPKDVLENMRSNFADQLSKYSNDDNKEEK